MTNLKSRRDELIKTMMWRVAHLDADDIGDYQQELEDLFDAAISELKPEIEKLVKALEEVRAGYRANLQEPINYAKHGLTTARKMLEGKDP